MKMFESFAISTLILIFSLPPVAANAKSMSLEQYISQVHEKNAGWKATQIEDKASLLLIREADSLTGVQFVTQANYMDDRRPTTNPGFQGNRTESTGFLFGLKQQTLLGVQWTLTQNFSHTHIYDAAPTAIPVPNYYDSFPKVELSVPLWRNFLGAEVSSQTNQMAQQSLSRKKQAELSRIQMTIEIEMAYHTLLAQLENVATQKDSIERAQKILMWTKKRIARNLTDAEDIYQSEAAVASRRMELLTAQKNLHESIGKFNSLRGIDSIEIAEDLSPVEIDLNKLKLARSPKKVRKDIRLGVMQDSATQASYQILKEKHKPQLDLNFSNLLQGRDTTLESSQSRMFGDNRNDLLVSVSLTIPLNQLRESEFRDAYMNLVESQKLVSTNRLQDSESIWNDTVTQADQLLNQILIMRELEQLQQAKANAERNKFNRGRSTLFQVLSYEQDYLNARSQRTNLELLIHQFISRLELFE